MAQVFETIGTSTSTSQGSTVTANASSTSWGTRVVLSASTSVAWDGFFLNVSFVDANQTVIEVATGGSGSEVAIIDGYLAGGGNPDMGHGMIYFPIPVPVSTRIAVRSSSSVGSSACRVSIIGVGTTQTKFLKEGSGEETIVGAGSLLGSTKGEVVDPGTTAHTKGAWKELDASAATDVDYISLTFVNNETAPVGNHDWLFDIGIGAISSEVVIVDNIPGHMGSGQDEYHPGAVGPFLVSISSGTRIAVRCQSSTTDTDDRLIRVLGHTMKFPAVVAPTQTSTLLLMGVGS